MAHNPFSPVDLNTSPSTFPFLSFSFLPLLSPRPTLFCSSLHPHLSVLLLLRLLLLLHPVGRRLPSASDGRQRVVGGPSLIIGAFASEGALYRVHFGRTNSFLLRTWSRHPYVPPGSWPVPHRQILPCIIVPPLRSAPATSTRADLGHAPSKLLHDPASTSEKLSLARCRVVLDGGLLACRCLWFKSEDP